MVVSPQPRRARKSCLPRAFRAQGLPRAFCAKGSICVLPLRNLLFHSQWKIPTQSEPSIKDPDPVGTFAFQPCHPRNFFPLISFADPHPLTLLESYRFKNMGGGRPLRFFQHAEVQSLGRSSVPCSANPFSHNLLSDAHPLNPVVSIFYKKDGGEGAPVRRFQRSHVQAFGRSHVHVPRPLESTLTQPPTSVDSKPLTTYTKSFISNTYKKYRGVG
jgi:hypothetical protein